MNNKTFWHERFWVSVLSVLLLFLAVIGNEAQAQDKLQDVLEKFLSYNGNQKEDAHDFIKERHLEKLEFDPNDFKLQEKFLWKVAIFYKDRIDDFKTPDSRKKYAIQTHKRCLDYIKWYDEKGSEKINEQIKNSADQENIYRITRHLGNAIIDIVDIEQPFLLFEEYAKIPDEKLLGYEAVDLWLPWLNSCPEMRKPGTAEVSSNTDELKKQVCNNKCNDYWKRFASVVGNWANDHNKYWEKRKKLAQRQRYVERVTLINKALEKCSKEQETRP